MFVNPDCEEVDVEDCPDPDPNAFISPTVTMKPQRKHPTIPRSVYQSNQLICLFLHECVNVCVHETEYLRSIFLLC